MSIRFSSEMIILNQQTFGRDLAFCTNTEVSSLLLLLLFAITDVTVGVVVWKQVTSSLLKNVLLAPLLLDSKERRVAVFKSINHVGELNKIDETVILHAILCTFNAHSVDQ